MYTSARTIFSLLAKRGLSLSSITSPSVHARLLNGRRPAYNTRGYEPAGPTLTTYCYSGRRVSFSLLRATAGSRRPRSRTVADGGRHQPADGPTTFLRPRRERRASVSSFYRFIRIRLQSEFGFFVSRLHRSFGVVRHRQSPMRLRLTSGHTRRKHTADCY